MNNISDLLSVWQRTISTRLETSSLRSTRRTIPAWKILEVTGDSWIGADSTETVSIRNNRVPREWHKINWHLTWHRWSTLHEMRHLFSYLVIATRVPDRCNNPNRWRITSAQILTARYSSGGQKYTKKCPKRNHHEWHRCRSEAKQWLRRENPAYIQSALAARSHTRRASCQWSVTLCSTSSGAE